VSGGGAEAAAGGGAGALGGTWGAVLLPVQEDEAVDFGALDAELDVLVSSRLEGIYTCGTAGEFYTLDEHEWDRLSEAVALRAATACVPFQLGASHMSGQICLSRVRRARQFRPAAIQVVLPDWMPLSWAEVQRTVSTMAEEADPVPIVLYNPPHAKTVCTAAQMAALAGSVPGLAGVKVAGDEPFYRDLHRAAPGLAIFAPGHELARARSWGAVGSYSNVACLQPAGAAEWGRSMETAPEAARALGDRVMAFFDAYMGPLKRQGMSNTALDKTLAAMGGWAPVGLRVRWPYTSVPETTAHQLAQLVRDTLPELF
jgi:dihydrodipicolinate synthase/N-acetylneuraminate lyase